MILIACVDDNLGMAFNRRRQSKDRALRERILAMAGDTPLWMSPYSAGQFEENRGNLRVEDDFLNCAGEQEFAFTELEEPVFFEDKMEGILLYRWNRSYPADLRFGIDLSGWRLVSVTEFAGHSHEMITEEIYTK